MPERKDRTMVVLGASGFVGMALVREAVADGWHVRAVVRRPEAARAAAALGAEVVTAEATHPEGWIEAARGADVLVDLVQPSLPERITRAAIETISRERQDFTRKAIAALQSIPVNDQPLWLSVSGAEDLAADSDGRLSHRSPLAAELKGFSNIGRPVRALLESAGIDVVYAYLGTVYGPGKLFAARIVPGLARGTFPVIGAGHNRLPLVEVSDAARALAQVALVGKPGEQFVIMDGAGVTQRELLELIARGTGGPRPRSVPRWIASLVAGRIAVDTMTADTPADPSALLATGFAFRYPSARAGVGPMLQALGTSG